MSRQLITDSVGSLIIERMKNKPLSPDDETSKLVSIYETAKSENKSIYLDSDQFVDIADFYLINDRFKEAQEAIDYGLSIHQGNNEILTELAFFYLATNQIKKAREIESILTDTYNNDYILLKAELLLREEKVEEAIAFLENYRTTQDLDLIYCIAELYSRFDQKEEEIIWLDKGLHLKKEDEGLNELLAEFYQDTGNTQKAIELYNLLIDKDVYNADYWMGLAKCYFDLSTFNKCIEACNFALTINDQLLYAYILRSKSYTFLENVDRAIEELKKAFDYLTDADYLINYEIGNLYLENENLSKAYAFYLLAQQKIESRQEDIEEVDNLYSQLAFCCVNLGKIDEARSYCQKGKALNPLNKQIDFIEGEIYLAEKRIEEANNQFDRINLNFQENEWANIVILYFKYNYFEEGFEYLNKIMNHLPESQRIDNEGLNSIFLELLIQKLQNSPETTDEIQELYDLIKQVENGERISKDDIIHFLKLLSNSN